MVPVRKSRWRSFAERFNGLYGCAKVPSALGSPLAHQRFKAILITLISTALFSLEHRPGPVSLREMP